MPAKIPSLISLMCLPVQLIKYFILALIYHMKTHTGRQVFLVWIQLLTEKLLEFSIAQLLNLETCVILITNSYFREHIF